MASVVIGRTGDGRPVVVADSLAASEVTINLLEREPESPRAQRADRVDGVEAVTALEPPFIDSAEP